MIIFNSNIQADLSGKETVKSKSFKDRLLKLLTGQEASLIIALILMCIVFTILSPYFLSLKNIINIGIYASIMGVMAAGLTVAMILGGMDVSQYANLALVGALVALMARAGWPAGVVVLIALAISVACGAINGFAIAVLRISPIITTLATMLLFRGLAYMLTEGRTLMVTGNFYTVVGRGYFLGIPNTIWIMIIFNILIALLLKYTSFGRKVFAVGGNPQASFLSGINLRKVRFIASVVSGFAAGVAGVLTVGQVGAAVPNAGETALMDVITAVILGGISLSGGKGKISGTLIGVFILATLNNGLVLLSVQSFYQMMIRGVVILLAVYVDVVRGGGFK